MAALGAEAATALGERRAHCLCLSRQVGTGIAEVIGDERDNVLDAASAVPVSRAAVRGTGQSDVNVGQRASEAQ